MIIYGINNCDTMQKAFKFLDKNKIKYRFHNYKTDGINKETLIKLFNQFPANTIINTKSTTFKSLTDTQKASIANKDSAIELMLQNPSMVKRPFLDLENGSYLIGFSEETYQSLLPKKSK